MTKKGVIHKGSGRPRTFVGVIQGITRDLQAQRDARLEQLREEQLEQIREERQEQLRVERLCDSLEVSEITPRPLSGLSGATAVRRDSDSLPRTRRSSLGRYESNRSYPPPSRPRPNYSRPPYRSPSPPPRYPSSSDARSTGLQRSATSRDDTRRTAGTRDPRDRLSTLPENRRPHPRDLEVRAIAPGAMPRQVQLAQRTTNATERGLVRQVGRGSRAELSAGYAPSYERTRDARSGRGRYDGGYDGRYDGRYDERYSSTRDR